MKKDQNLPNKNIHSNISSGESLPNSSNYSRNQSLIFLNTEIDHQIEEIHESLHKTDIVDHTVEILKLKKFIHDQIQTERTILLITVPNHSLEKNTIQMTDHEIHLTIDIEIILTIETEAIQIIEIKDIIIDQENF